MFCTQAKGLHYIQNSPSTQPSTGEASNRCAQLWTPLFNIIATKWSMAGKSQRSEMQDRTKKIQGFQSKERQMEGEG